MNREAYRKIFNSTKGSILLTKHYSIVSLQMESNNMQAIATMCPKFDVKGTDVYGR